jgi:TRAP-type C4-dicarboxylate transport system permease small subunit
MKLTKSEIGLLLTLLILSFFGFMIKLPSIFRHHDRELHFLFYLLTAIFFNLILGKEKLTNLIIIFFSLLFFGIGIEVLQELSNHISTKKIHGNFDPVDVFYNVMGLIVATLFWGVSLMVKKIIYSLNNIKNENKD